MQICELNTTAVAGGWIAEDRARMSWDNCWVRMVQQARKGSGATARRWWTGAGNMGEWPGWAAAASAAESG